MPIRMNALHGNPTTSHVIIFRLKLHYIIAHWKTGKCLQLTDMYNMSVLLFITWPPPNVLLSCTCSHTGIPWKCMISYYMYEHLIMRAMQVYSWLVYMLSMVDAGKFLWSFWINYRLHGHAVQIPLYYTLRVLNY